MHAFNIPVRNTGSEKIEISCDASIAAHTTSELLVSSRPNNNNVESCPLSLVDDAWYPTGKAFIGSSSTNQKTRAPEIFVLQVNFAKSPRQTVAFAGNTLIGLPVVEI